MRHLPILLAGTLLCLALAAGGCVTGSGSTATAGRQMPTYRALPSSGPLDGEAQLAAVTLDLARNNVLPDGPLVTLAPDATVALAPAPPGFSETGKGIANADQLGDGLYSVEVVRQYEDGLGRRAMVLDLAVYALFEPDNRALNTRAGELRAAYVAAMRSNDPAVSAAMTSFVSDFQQEYGLRPSGALDPRTATAMAAATPIQTFQILASAPLYAETPRFEFHLLDESYGRNAPDTYLRGFESLPAVRAEAVPDGQYASASARGGRYLALVHFLDRLPPGTPVQVAFSGYETRKARERDATSPVLYADGRSWPVLVVPVTLKGVTGKLYAHVLAGGRILGTVRLK
jgi:peptidoglycan hydrolase-like protein with peptidoglycan-binding domain